MIQKIIAKCEEEIEWAQACIDEMNLPDNPHNYQEDDKIWLPCWLKAHKNMLDLIITDAEAPDECSCQNEYTYDPFCPVHGTQE